jgi:hypothetical protein
VYAVVVTLVTAPLEVALGPLLLIDTVNWSVLTARPAIVFATVSFGAIGVFVNVQMMLSPAAGVTAILVPVPGATVVPPVPLFVQA